MLLDAPGPQTTLDVEYGEQEDVVGRRCQSSSLHLEDQKGQLDNQNVDIKNIFHMKIIIIEQCSVNWVVDSLRASTLFQAAIAQYRKKLRDKCNGVFHKF